MNGERRTGFVIRRIVVALDGSTHGRAALETAAELAARLEADLEGLFVEDIDLINLAALPFGHELSLTTGQARPFDTKTLQDQLDREIAHARRALEAAARRMRVRSTFRVARGRPVTEIVAAAGDADLLILGAAGYGIGVRFRPGRAALAAAENAPRSVLLLRSGAVIRGRPLVAYDGSDGAEKALAAAARLARAGEGAVRVAIGETDPEKAEALRRRVADRLAGGGLRLTFHETPAATLEALCRIVRESDADILVLAAADPRLAGEGRSRLLEILACPVLLVR